MHSDNRVAVLDDNRVNDPDDSNFCPNDSRVVVPDPVAWKRNKAKGKKIQTCEGALISVLFKFRSAWYIFALISLSF